MKTPITPTIHADFPDPDIIRVGDTYYMASTTMHFMPGGDLLQSKDLRHWQWLPHVFETLEDNPAHNLAAGNIYGRGMWAPSLNYANGIFSVAFTCNDTHKTLVYTAQSAAGPWQRHTMEGFYYDPSLFFDEDGRVYIVHGNGALNLTELDPATWAPRPGGLQRVLVQDAPGQPLGYEGSHLYKHAGKYYLFTCHMPQADPVIKTEDCFLAESLTAPFVGKNILCGDGGWRGLGVAQGGMVDTPQGDWYLFMFQDRGALGRAPVLMPMHFDAEGYPVPEWDGLLPEAPATRAALTGDAFCSGGHLAPWWQFGHNPDESGYTLNAEANTLTLTTTTTAQNLFYARNTLTRRCFGTGEETEITLDGSGLQEGDCAGLCAFIGNLAALSLTKRGGKWLLEAQYRPAKDETVFGDANYSIPPATLATATLASPVVRLKLRTDFAAAPDTVQLFYNTGDGWQPLGTACKVYFKMDFFTGCRIGLFCYSTVKAGGTARFSGLTTTQLEQEKGIPHA